MAKSLARSVRVRSGTTVVGLTEKVRVFGRKAQAVYTARIDTGATKSSIDKALARKIGVGPVIRKKLVKSASGKSLRPVVCIKIMLGKKSYSGEFTIADRAHMRYKLLIGQNILTKGFLIDPLKGERKSKKKKR